MTNKIVLTLGVDIHENSLCKFVTEVDEVLSARGQILPQHRHCGVQVGLDGAHVGAVVAHSIQGMPRELHRLERVGRCRCKVTCRGIQMGVHICWLIQSRSI